MGGLMIKEDGTVVFEGKEQEELNRIVGERLSREGIHDMKEIVETLKLFGYEGTPTEIKQAIKAQAEQAKLERAEEQKQAEIDALKQELKGETSPEIIAQLKAEIKSANEKLDAITKKEQDALKAAEQQRINAENWQKQETEFTTKYPNVDLQKLDNDKDFIEFVKDTSPRLTLTERYEKYVKLLGGAESKAMEKFKLNSERSTGSGRNVGNVGGGTYGLTSRQQQLADENGMSYKDYAENLKLIKR
jgi:SMC interacting uncharacterized protein involved in chromosome segregation